MSASSPIGTRDQGRLRQAAFAALAWAGFQAWAFAPLAIRHAAGWQVAWPAVAQIGVTLLVAGLTLSRRGALLGAGMLGAYGAYRLALFVWAVGFVLSGAAAAAHTGPAVVLAIVVAVPFALVWLRGGLAAWRLLRDVPPALGRAI